MIISNNVAYKLIVLIMMTTSLLTLNAMELASGYNQDEEIASEVISLEDQINTIAEMVKDPAKNTFSFVKKIKEWCEDFGPKLTSEHLDEVLTRAGVSLLAVKDGEGWTILHWAVFMRDVKLAQCFLSVADDEAWNLICMKTILDRTAYCYAEDDEMKNLLLAYHPEQKSNK